MLGILPKRQKEMQKGTEQAKAEPVPGIGEIMAGIGLFGQQPAPIAAQIINQAAPAAKANTGKPKTEQAASPVMDFLSKGIGQIANVGGIVKSLLPTKEGLELPPIMNMVEALPPEINTIADAVAPPTEAQIAAAPVAVEPPSVSGNFEMHFNPTITINGNADSSTVSQLEGALSQMKAELMREFERKLDGMLSAREHRQRRISLAT